MLWSLDGSAALAAPQPVAVSGQSGRGCVFGVLLVGKEHANKVTPH